MPDPNYHKWGTKVKSVEKINEKGKDYYLIEFENGLSMRSSEMQYKLAHEPKPGQEYTVIRSGDTMSILKNYKSDPNKKPSRLKRNYGPLILKKMKA
jgi:hypothetical protein